MTFYWLTPFADSFVDYDWRELVSCFHIKVVYKMFLWSTLRQQRSEKIRIDWYRDISRRTAESRRYVFRR